jgi:transcriptional regulator with XRE-family HTH domain
MNGSAESLKRELDDPEYRAAYAESFLDLWIATQIRVLREQRGLSQTTLAEKTGMKQTAISRLEDINHSAWTISTLKRLARAFGLYLSVKFEPFGNLLEDAEHAGRPHLERSSFDDDPAFKPIDPNLFLPTVSANVWTVESDVRHTYHSSTSEASVPATLESLVVSQPSKTVSVSTTGVN